MNSTIEASEPYAELSGCGIVFSRGPRRVLNGVDLSLRQGEVVSLLGCNGAGKTTLLRILLGLINPAYGTVSLNGTPLSRYSKRDLAKKIAYVPQAHQPHFPYSVRDIVSLGRVPSLGLLGTMRDVDRTRIDDILRHLEIYALAERPYTELSSGERQLAIIARAMAQESRLLILDEPLSGLDYGHQIRLMSRLRRLADDGYGILMTTHDPDRALATSSRIATLIDGVITDDGNPREVLTADAIFRLYGVRGEFSPSFNPRMAPQ